MSRQGNAAARGRREGVSLSLIILLFFYFLFIIRRENLEDVRDFVLYWKGEAKLVRQPDGDADYDN